MVNPNTYKTAQIECYSIEITREDESYQTYVLMKNQMISVLRINPRNGKVEVNRGRMDKFIIQPKRWMNDPNQLFAIKLDISEHGKSNFVVITVESILEINPIDWTYQDTDKVVAQYFPDDWYEKDKKVSAPPSIREFRIGDDI